MPVCERNRAMARAWLTWLANHGRKPHTCYQYGQKLDDLCEWAAERPLGGLMLTDLEAWIDRPRTRRAHGAQGADATKAKDVVVLKGFWRFLCSHGHLSLDVTAELQAPTIRNHNPKAIPPETWACVWRGDHLQEVERVVLGLGFYCGLRREEICRLEPRHLDMTLGRIVHFPRKGDRNSRETGVLPFLSCARLFGERKPELIGMPEAFLLPLERLYDRQRAERWLIPWGARALGRRTTAAPGPPDGMTNPDQINATLKRILRRSGLPETAFSPHALRHSFVTYMLAMSVPLEAVAKLAGHSSVNITIRYARIADDPLAAFLGDHTEPLWRRGRW